MSLNFETFELKMFLFFLIDVTDANTPCTRRKLVLVRTSLPAQVVQVASEITNGQNDWQPLDLSGKAFMEFNVLPPFSQQSYAI